MMPAYDVRISDWSLDVCSSDLVKVGPENLPPAQAGRPQGLAGGPLGHERPLGGALLADRRVVELVAAQAGAGGAERGVAALRDQTVTKLQPTAVESRRQRQQPGHRVRGSPGVDDRVAERHVAAALAVAPGVPAIGGAQPGQKGSGGCEGAGGQLRIAARQEDRKSTRLNSSH